MALIEKISHSEEEERKKGKTLSFQQEVRKKKSNCEIFTATDFLAELLF